MGGGGGGGEGGGGVKMSLGQVFFIKFVLDLPERQVVIAP